jgi:hypothetical protein
MFLLHPGQQQHITDFVVFNILDPGFRRGDEMFFNKLLAVVDFYLTTPRLRNTSRKFSTRRRFTPKSE